MWLVDHAYEGQDAYEVVAVHDASARKRVQVDSVKVVLRRGEQVLAFVDGGWLACAVVRTAHLSDESAFSGLLDVVELCA
jgi:hypothetical protein